MTKIEVNLLDFDIDKSSKKRKKFLNWVERNSPEKMSTIHKLNHTRANAFKKAMLLNNAMT